MKEVRQGTYTYKEDSNVFNFVTDLSVSEKLTFVNSIVDIVVDEDNYNSIIKDLMFDYMIISIFTDVDMSFIKTIDNNGNRTFNIDLLEEFLLETNIVDIVKANAFPALFYELDRAIDLNIEYKTGIGKNTLNEALTSLTNTIEKKVNDFDMSSIDLNKMSEMIQLFTNMSNEFTPENVVKAYTQSDIFKKNMADIEKSRENRIKAIEEASK